MILCSFCVLREIINEKDGQNENQEISPHLTDRAFLISNEVHFPLQGRMSSKCFAHILTSTFT